jgi:N-methylhydantoinase A
MVFREADRVQGFLSIGIDVGGTFTDLFMVDERSGETYRHKLSSTPEDPHEAPVRGVREILERAGRRPEDVRFIGLGTTVATNALLERKGAPTGLLTTKGFRDLLEIARQTRPHVYDLFMPRVKPLARRRARLEVAERIAGDGSVIKPIEVEDIDRAIDSLRAQGIASVAICFLNSFANPEHERAAVARLREIWPDATVSASEELLPEIREYERLSSTVMNAYLMPVMRRYLLRFQNEIEATRVSAAPVVMSSGGGVFSPELAAERPIDTLLSGPSGGISAATYLGGVIGRKDLITFDMGGTSTDVSLIADGKAEISTYRVIDGLPIRSIAVDVHTVGAGGSSIAWLDEGGLLRVGPASAGARPGPACYGLGGAEPTVTDANVILGRLNQHHLLGGALPIDRRRAAEAIGRAVAKPKGIGLTEAASAILAISVMNIAQAIRVVSVERGLDPADFLLVAFGGAGPLHAADVARELDMEVIIPSSPGVLCAMGVLTKEAQVDVSRTRILRESTAGLTAEVDAVFADLERRVAEMLRRGRLGADGLSMRRSVEARYVGQNHELNVPLPDGLSGAAAVAAVRLGFDAAHRRLYGYDQPTKELELVTFRLRATMPGPKVDLRRTAVSQRSGALRPSGRRDVIFGAADAPIECPVLDRAQLRPGDEIAGAAIIEQMDTTTLLPPDFRATVDPAGNLLLRRC